MGSIISLNTPMDLTDAQKEIDYKLIKLYRSFFFYDDYTDLEIKIEHQYLDSKLEKYQSYINLKVYLTDSQFKLLLEYKKWKEIQMDYEFRSKEFWILWRLPSYNDGKVKRLLDLIN